MKLMIVPGMLVCSSFLISVFGMFLDMLERRLFSSVLAITERRDMGLYEVPLSLLGFGRVTTLANFHIH